MSKQLTVSALIATLAMVLFAVSAGTGEAPSTGSRAVAGGPLAAFTASR